MIHDNRFEMKLLLRENAVNKNRMRIYTYEVYHKPWYRTIKTKIYSYFQRSCLLVITMKCFYSIVVISHETIFLIVASFI